MGAGWGGGGGGRVEHSLAAATRFKQRSPEWFEMFSIYINISKG